VQRCTLTSEARTTRTMMPKRRDRSQQNVTRTEGDYTEAGLMLWQRHPRIPGPNYSEGIQMISEDLDAISGIILLALGLLTLFGAVLYGAFSVSPILGVIALGVILTLAGIGLLSWPAQKS
jgi:hypothetical protein